MTPAFQRYVDPARPGSQVWRLGVGLVVILFIYILGIALIGLGLWFVHGTQDIETRLEALARGADPQSMLLMLATFAAAWAGLWVAVKRLHKRSLGSVIGRPAMVLRDFALGLGVIFPVGLLVAYWAGLSLDALPALPLKSWLMLLPLALIGILIQTGAEEAIFRGYLQQNLAARFASPLIWMGLPSVLFGLVHYAPETSGSNVWIIVLVTGFFGLIAADLTARTGSLGLAWGLHFGNNLVPLLFLSAGMGLDGLTLFRIPEGALDDALLRKLLLGDLVALGLVWLVCIALLRRR
jgi:membrane protease YdiL (CAAX protease family)